MPGVTHPQVPTAQPGNDLRLVLNTHVGTGYPMLASASHAEGCYPCQFDALNVR